MLSELRGHHLKRNNIRIYSIFLFPTECRLVSNKQESCSLTSKGGIGMKRVYIYKTVAGSVMVALAAANLFVH
jgi:hypothetical protein